MQVFMVAMFQDCLSAIDVNVDTFKVTLQQSLSTARPSDLTASQTDI